MTHAIVQTIARTVHGLLTAFRHEMVGLWAWAPFYDLLAAENPAIRWYAVQVTAKLHSFSEQALSLTLSKFVLACSSHFSLINHLFRFVDHPDTITVQTTIDQIENTMLEQAIMFATPPVSIEYCS